MKRTDIDIIQMVSSRTLIEVLQDSPYLCDPFQDAVPCWHPEWYWPTAKERRAGRLAADQALRESLGPHIRE